MAKVTRAVQIAHRQGILHRDLKPGNILLDGRGEPLVSDFGLAKWLDTSSDLTRTLTIFGTPGYIAPEQARGPAAGLRPSSDIYSLGAILFDLLSGRPPFLGEHALTVIHQAAESPAPKLRSLVKGADRDLETICAHCLEREPAGRYQSAGDLAEDLERWLEGRPIIARPVLASVRLWRWSKRNPLLATTLGAVAILGTTAFLRQVESHRMAETIRQGQLAARSVAILPVLDLDTVEKDDEIAKKIEIALRKAMAPFGPVRLAAMPAASGTGTIKDLQVIARKSSARLALASMIRWKDGRRRLTLRLQDAKTGELLWSKTLEGKRPLPVFETSAVGKDFFARVSGAIPIEPLEAADPVVSDSTANEFLHAGDELMNHRTTSDTDRAIACYRRAIVLQPASAAAHAAFVRACLARMEMAGADPALLGEAEKRAREAVKLDPSSAQTHRALAHLAFRQGNLKRAREEVLQAIEAGSLGDVASSMAMIEKVSGRPDLALRWSVISSHWRGRPADDEYIPGDCWADLAADSEAASFYRRVSALHPEIPEGWIGLCRLKMLEGDFTAAREICRSNLDRYRDYSFSRQMEAQVEFFAGNYPAAERLYSDLAGKDPSGGGAFYGCVSFSSALGFLHHLQGDKAGGRKLLEETLAWETKALRSAPEHPEILYRLAALESSLGLTSTSLRHLAAAANAGWLDYRSSNLDPRFDAIRTSAQYSKITQTMAARVAFLRQSQLKGRE